MTTPTFRAIVPAGGAGTRLWPLSRPTRPKFLHDLTGSGRSLLQETVDRLLPVADEVVIVTGAAHIAAVRAQLSLPAESFFAEPSPRDSMAAIALAAAVLRNRYPGEDLVIGSFAADHLITQPETFRRAVRTAIAAAREDYLVTIGIEPQHASTAFGYIRMGSDREGYRLVDDFVEKPDRSTAERYFHDGNYAWNGGIYVSRADRLLEHVRHYQPDLAAGIDEIAAAWDTQAREQVLSRIWPQLPAIAIDHAVSEPLAAAGGVAVVPADLGWSDIGDWEAIAQLGPAAEPEHAAQNSPGPTVLGAAGAADRVHVHDSAGAVVVPGAATVVVLGIPDAVVVNTGDALLVTTRDRAQDVKGAVDQLPARWLHEPHGGQHEHGCQACGRGQHD